MSLLPFLSLCTFFLLCNCKEDFSCKRRLYLLSESEISSLVQRDDRPYVALSSFCGYDGNYHKLTIRRLSFLPSEHNHTIGLTVEKIPFVEDALDNMGVYRDRCLLYEEQSMIKEHKDFIFFVMDFRNKLLRVNCSAESTVSKLRILGDLPSLPVLTQRKLPFNDSQEKSLTVGKCIREKTSCADNLTIPLKTSSKGYVIKIVLHVPSEKERGQYRYVFHSCENYKSKDKILSSFIWRRAEGTLLFLKLAEGYIPLQPYIIHFIVLLFMIGCWIFKLMEDSERNRVRAVHLYICLTIGLKFVCLIFRYIYQDEIHNVGEPRITWAVLYYTVHLFRESLLLMTVWLLGTGYSYVQRTLSRADEIRIVIVISLQVFTSIAGISSETDSEITDYNDRLITVFEISNLLCWIAVLFALFPSTIHLPNSFETQSNRSRNLITMLLCYVCFTKMDVNLLEHGPFPSDWYEICRELATFTFFVVTTCHFTSKFPDAVFHVDENDGNAFFRYYA